MHEIYINTIQDFNNYQGGCIKNKLFDTLFLYIAIESAKIIKRPIFGDFPKIFDSRGV